MKETLFSEMKCLVGFGAEDEQNLQFVYPVVSKHFDHIVAHFYEVLFKHEGTHAVFSTESQIVRLKQTLKGWLDRLFQGPYDESYFELRSKIGQAHVRINLPQHYMFTTMNLIRDDLQSILFEAFYDDPSRLNGCWRSVGKILDLELAIMLETYRNDMVEKFKRQDRLATIGQLAASMNHELKNPLGVILSSLFILKRKLSNNMESSIRHHFDKIERNLNRANLIISQLLTFSRAKSPELRPVSLASVFAEVRDTLNLPGNIVMNHHIPQNLPLVRGDTLQLSLVFQNLVTNSIQAMPDGGAIFIEASVENGYMKVSILDQGTGIPTEIQPKVFEPLFTTKSTGTGLGLAICQNIIEAHVGRITFHSPIHEAGGTQFVVYLPIC